eukprot:jgi/Botrbrau1/5265/Bobra.0172s0124.1
MAQAHTLEDVTTEARVVFIIALRLQAHGQTRDAFLQECQKYLPLDAATTALEQLLLANVNFLREANGLLQVNDGAAPAVQDITRLDFSLCRSLWTLPPEIGQLTNLQQLDLTRCRSLSALPQEIGQLENLQELILYDCPSLSALPHEIGRLRALQNLYLTGCKRLSALPPQIGHLPALQRLSLSHCDSLSALPPQIGQLPELLLPGEQAAALPGNVGLKNLDLSACRSLLALPKKIGNLKQLTELKLSHCDRLSSLPRELGDLTQLKSLDLSYCMQLEAVPSSLTKLTSLTRFEFEGFQDLSYNCLNQKALVDNVINVFRTCHMVVDQPAAPNVNQNAGPDVDQNAAPNVDQNAAPDVDQNAAPDVDQNAAPKVVDQNAARKNVQWFLAVMKRKAALDELATRQEPMVNALTSMSWLVILLATATFIAFLQPLGGLDEKSHMVRSDGLDLAACGAGGSLWGTVQAPEQASTAQAPEQAGSRLGAAICFTWWFFILDALSFGLSIACVMMIVVVSMPRVATRDKYYEAGRFWWLLLLTWGLLWAAVVTGFIAFLFSGLATVSTKDTVWGPLVPGMLLLVVGLILLVIRLRGNLYPGQHAICTAFKVCLCCGSGLSDEREFEDEDVEIGHQMSRAYWEQAALLLRRG